MQRVKLCNVLCIATIVWDCECIDVRNRLFETIHPSFEKIRNFSILKTHLDLCVPVTCITAELRIGMMMAMGLLVFLETFQNQNAFGNSFVSKTWCKLCCLYRSLVILHLQPSTFLLVNSELISACILLKSGDNTGSDSQLWPCESRSEGEIEISKKWSFFFLQKFSNFQVFLKKKQKNLKIT